jgi:hypothetical protein
MAPDTLPEPVRVALAIAATLERLDQDYMRVWAERLGVSDILDRAIREGSPE